jgi:TetR/AcrR family transcriptional regulator, transcriptional repressor of aconitase
MQIGISIHERILMKKRRRLTRRESKEVTHMRLIEAAERLFIRKGFDDASVGEISETAGYSRGAFYSNFNDKEQVFLAVIDRRRPQVLKALDDIFQQISGPAERIAAVREWFSNQWRLKDFMALRMEFSRRAMRDRSARKHLAELSRQELETYAASVGRYVGTTDGILADRPEIVALVLLAVAHGLGSLAIGTEPEWERLYTEAAKLAFDRMSAPQIS